MLLMKRGDQLLLQIFLLSTLFSICRATSVKGSSITPTQVKPSQIASPNNISAVPIISTLSVINVTTTTTSIVSRTTNISSPSATLINVTLSFTAVPIKTSAIGPTKHHTTREHHKGTSRKFDGLSFFGGIIVGATISVILLFSLKYYQAKKRSYHAL